MKVNYCMMMLIAVAIVSGCSKDEDPSADRYRLIKVDYKDGTTAVYDYNDAGQVTKVSHDGSSTTYNYNSRGLLIGDNGEGTRYQYYRTNFVYRADDTAEESILNYKMVGEAETRYKTTYKYIDGRIVEMTSAYWIVALNTWSSPAITEYNYNVDGLVIRSTSDYYYTEYSYDTRGNLARTKAYEKTYDGTKFYMWRQTDMTYDDKKDIYSTTSAPYPNPHKRSTNNLLDYTSRTYDETGTVVSTSSYSLEYEYNEAGYPIRRTNEEFTLEQY